MSETTSLDSIPEIYRPDNFPTRKIAWLWQHPTATLTLVVAFFGAMQWVGSRLLHELSEPERKKTAAEIRGIRRDVRALVVHQMESQRYTREVLGDLARAQNIEVNRPPELIAAEKAARKIRNR